MNGEFADFVLAQLRLHPAIKELLELNEHLSVARIDLEEQEIIVYDARNTRYDGISAHLGYSGLVAVVD